MVIRRYLQERENGVLLAYYDETGGIPMPLADASHASATGFSDWF
jgi:hypothetical protein